MHCTTSRQMDRTPIDVAREKGFTTLATLLEARAVGSKVKEQECLRQLQHEEGNVLESDARSYARDEETRDLETGADEEGRRTAPHS